MNRRKLFAKTDLKRTKDNGLQHSESFKSLVPFVWEIENKQKKFFGWLINFDAHCITIVYVVIEITKHLVFVFYISDKFHGHSTKPNDDNIITINSNNTNGN
jgi:hypothetical protein